MTSITRNMDTEINRAYWTSAKQSAAPAKRYPPWKKWGITDIQQSGIAAVKDNKTHEPCNEHDTPTPFIFPKYSSTYIDLATDRIIFLTEPFTKDTASEMTALLLHYDNEDPNTDIVIYIHSDGGDASALTNIYDVMRMCKAPITTIVAGKAYSAGAFLLMAGDYRLAFAHSEAMIHGIQTIYPGLGKEGIADSKDYLKFLTDTDNKVMNIIVEATGKDLAQVKKDCSKDLYMDAKQMLAYGIIDEIIGQ